MQLVVASQRCSSSHATLLSTSVGSCRTVEQAEADFDSQGEEAEAAVSDEQKRS